MQDARSSGRHDRTDHQARVPLWILALVAVAMAALIMSARSGPIVVGVLTALVLVGTRGRTVQPGFAAFITTPALAFTLAWIVWAALSLLWTPAPAQALEKALGTFAIVGLGALACRAKTTLTADELRQIAVALAIGFAAGTLFIGIELMSDQAIKRWVFNTFPELRPGSTKGLRIRDGEIISVSANERNRSIAVIMLAFWPVLAAAIWVTTGRLQSRAGAIIGVVATIAVALVIFASNHESSKVGIVVSSLVVVAALVSARMVRWALVLAWVVGTMAVLPVSATLYAQNWHFAEVLPKTAQARVILWGETARRWSEAPVLGHGVHATRAYQDVEKGTYEQPPGYVYPKSTGRHAHNAYLQTWFELGTIGALLFAAAGCMFAWQVGRAPPDVRPALLATFAAVAVMAAFSYGIWQAWYQCLILLSVYGAVFVATLARGSQVGSQIGLQARSNTA